MIIHQVRRHYIETLLIKHNCLDKEYGRKWLLKKIRENGCSKVVRKTFFKKLTKLMIRKEEIRVGDPNLLDLRKIFRDRPLLMYRLFVKIKYFPLLSNENQRLIAYRCFWVCPSWNILHAKLVCLRQIFLTDG